MSFIESLLYVDPLQLNGAFKCYKHGAELVWKGQQTLQMLPFLADNIREELWVFLLRKCHLFY